MNGNLNGDLSLSRALGGLRIANPDNASSTSPSRRERHESEDDEEEDEDVIARSRSPPSPSTGRDPTTTSQEADRWGSQGQGKGQGQHEGPRSVTSRSSMYAALARSESREAAAAAAAGPRLPCRQPSRSYHGGRPSGPPPPRISSKGMGVGYAPVAGPAPIRAGPDMAGPVGPVGLHPAAASSEEWKDRGAAVSLRRELDPQGRTVIRSVKKGVRDFSFGKMLGEGSYSTVYLATDRQTLREYAVKVLEKKHIIKEKKIKYVNIEKNTLNRLTEHPGIVRLYYTFQDETSLYYVLDLCAGGELLGVLKRTGTLDEDCTKFYGAQILDAVAYMHSRGVIHRDLKPENVLLDGQMHVKITDFGTAKLLPDPRDAGRAEAKEGTEVADYMSEEKQAASFVGTAEYVSPELLTDKAAGKPSDLWALGCIIYQLLAGRPPFKAGTEYLTFQKIVKLEYEFPPAFPPLARDLVERCLVLDPVRRLTVENMRKHDFFDGQQFGTDLWRTKAPRLRPYVPAQENVVKQTDGVTASVAMPMTSSRNQQAQAQAQAQTQATGTRPARIITELPPPTQLDIEWSPVLTRSNERILKLGDLTVISCPTASGQHGKGEHDGHKKLSRFFGGSTTKKRQRLVMVTSSGRILLCPTGGEEKKAKQEISLLVPDCAWKSQTDAKGQMVWTLDTAGVHYTFEEPRSSSPHDGAKYSVQDWIESLEQARDTATAQNQVGSYSSDNGFGDMSSSMSSPASTLAGRTSYPDGFTISDRLGRKQASKSQASLEDANVKRNRFSKRPTKNGLGAAF